MGEDTSTDGRVVDSGSTRNVTTWEERMEVQSSMAYRAGIACALGAAAILVWLSLGVGIIGRDGDPANRMYLAVLAVGAVGAVIARFQPRGMARALFATAIAQALISAFAVIAKLGLPWSGPAEILLLNAFFVAAFATSGLLFLRDARERSSAAL